MNPESEGEMFPGFSDDAVLYVAFLAQELEFAEGAMVFRFHEPAPPDMTVDQLEILAIELRMVGWNAEVRPLRDDEDSPLGILVDNRPLEQ